VSDRPSKIDSEPAAASGSHGQPTAANSQQQLTASQQQPSEANSQQQHSQ